MYIKGIAYNCLISFITLKVLFAHSQDPNYKETMPLIPIKGDKVPNKLFLI